MSEPAEPLLRTEDLEYFGLGACFDCDHDERGGTRVYRVKADVGVRIRVVMDPPRCRSCWRRHGVEPPTPQPPAPERR